MIPLKILWGTFFHSGNLAALTITMSSLFNNSRDDNIGA